MGVSASAPDLDTPADHAVVKPSPRAGEISSWTGIGPLEMRRSAPIPHTTESRDLGASTGYRATSRRWWYLPYALVGRDRFEPARHAKSISTKLGPTCVLKCHSPRVLDDVRTNCPVGIVIAADAATNSAACTSLAAGRNVVAFLWGAPPATLLRRSGRTRWSACPLRDP